MDYVYYQDLVQVQYIVHSTYNSVYRKVCNEDAKCRSCYGQVSGSVSYVELVRCDLYKRKIYLSSTSIDVGKCFLFYFSLFSSEVSSEQALLSAE